MTDVLIRGLSPQTLSRLDAMARRLGLSRGTLLRRQVEQMTEVSDTIDAPIDWARFSSVHQDLADPDVMSQAWR